MCLHCLSLPLYFISLDILQIISFAQPSLDLSLLFSTITVASEFIFSVGDRVIDETRAKLLSDVVEVLVTTDDWIESTKKMCKCL